MSSEEKAENAYKNTQELRAEIGRLMEELSPEKLPKIVYEVSPGGYSRRILPLIRELNNCVRSYRREVLNELFQSQSIPRVEMAELSGVSPATLSRWAREAGAVRSRR
jgi:hypothetical protein